MKKVTIYNKDGQESICDSDQIDILVNAGWSLEAPKADAKVKKEGKSEGDK